MRSALVSVLVLGSVVSPGAVQAAPKQPLDEFLLQFYSELGMSGSSKSDTATPRFAMLDSETRVDTPYERRPDGADFSYEPNQVLIGWAADKQSAWAVIDLPLILGGMGGTNPTVSSLAHGVAVVTPRGAKWHPVAYTFRATVADKDQADTLKAGALPPAITRKVEAGAEAVAKQFESTIGDPKAFAASVSDRPEVVLYGSAREERYDGGAKAAATLAKWSLKAKVRDGVQAGLVGATLAWVAANVDVTAAGAKESTPYQLFTVYEKTGAAWKLVVVQYAFYTGRSF